MSVPTPRPEPETLRLTLAELRTAAGTELGRSGWVELSQERIDAFAEATGDRQWIHVDPERAATGPFGTAIAHGYLTLSLLAPFLDDLLVVPDAGMAINYGLGRVRFPAPAPSGSRVRGHGRIDAVDEIDDAVHVALAMTVECAGTAKPVCVAELLARYYP